MGSQERYPIGELVRRSGVPAATIHHYLRIGLLAPARRVASNRFLYDDRHLVSLRVIRALRDQRSLPLSRIRRVLPELLSLGGEEALRPESWDEVLGRRVGPRLRTGHDRILSAAMNAFARQGYGGVNVDDICRAARVAKGSFYRHWRSKEELFFATADAARADVVFEFAKAMTDPEARRSPSEALARALEPRLPIFMDLFTRAVQRRPGYPPVARRVFSTLAREVGEEMGGGEQPVAAGALTLTLAAAGIFRTALEPSPLSDLADVGRFLPLFAVPPTA
jgi:AcrR family transcriptional regulator